MKNNNRRNFIKQTGLVASASCVPLMGMASSDNRGGYKFNFAFISDTHIASEPDGTFIKKWDTSLVEAVKQLNQKSDQVDFVIVGGDLTHTGKPEEFSRVKEILSQLQKPIYFAIGEHDCLHDASGAMWKDHFGDDYYSFDHKNVHFVVINSIMKSDQTGKFIIAKPQLEWLHNDLSKVSKETEVVLISHLPLVNVKNIDDSSFNSDGHIVQSLLTTFNKASVFFGHVHQQLQFKVDAVIHSSGVSTAWSTYGIEKRYLQSISPTYLDSSREHLASTSWQLIEVNSQAELSMKLKIQKKEPIGVAKNYTFQRGAVSV
ncbi:MAG: metallophosphoesterase [Methylacidiphilales bacterium]|nr:metallophosphoesterase [Candidatus Methylacidiphilales bacterium]